MFDPPPTDKVRSRKGHLARLLGEGALVALSGIVLALAANALSPQGLNLRRNYFPHAPAVLRPAVNEVSRTRSAAKLTETNLAMLDLAAKVEAEGLQWASSSLAEQLYRDPRYEQELVLFLDARNDAHYEEGHVPGAYQFDPYRPERYLGTVLPLCENAEQIVVYCNGGDCEDSKIAALLLVNAGVSKTKFHIYLEGMPDWTASHRPVEIGTRNSGVVRTLAP